MTRSELAAETCSNLAAALIADTEWYRRSLFSDHAVRRPGDDLILVAFIEVYEIV